MGKQAPLEVKDKFFYYYPNWDENHSRSVVAGHLEGDTIYVAIAECYKGTKPRKIKVKLSNKSIVTILDPIPLST